MKATVSEKGQVTIPKRLRERLDIRPGEVLDFEEDGGVLVARKAAHQAAVDGLFGILETPGGSDVILRRLRGEADAV